MKKKKNMVTEDSKEKLRWPKPGILRKKIPNSMHAYFDRNEGGVPSYFLQSVTLSQSFIYALDGI